MRDIITVSIYTRNGEKKVERDPDDINSSSTPYNTVDDELEWDNSPDNYRLGKSRVLL